MSKDSKEEILNKHWDKAYLDLYGNQIENITNAMQEYSDLQSSEKDKRIKELEARLCVATKLAWGSETPMCNHEGCKKYVHDKYCEQCEEHCIRKYAFDDED